ADESLDASVCRKEISSSFHCFFIGQHFIPRRPPSLFLINIGSSMKDCTPLSLRKFLSLSFRTSFRLSKTDLFCRKSSWYSLNSSSENSSKLDLSGCNKPFAWIHRYSCLNTSFPTRKSEYYSN